jgi:hypothetical protein
MRSNRSIEPPDPAEPGVITGETSAPADPRDLTNRARGPFARLLSVLRGDKYLVDAYEPAWSALVMRRAAVVPQER